MARYSQEKRAYHMARIRTLLVRRPHMSVPEIIEALATSPKAPLKVTHNYVNAIVRKIHRERAHRLDHKQLRVVLGEIEDELEELRVRLWNALVDKELDAKSKVMLAKEIRENRKMLLQSLFDAGIFDRKLGTIKQQTTDVKLDKLLERLDEPEREKVLDELARILRPDRSEGESVPDEAERTD